jgi:hypothetical protein
MSERPIALRRPLRRRGLRNGVLLAVFVFGVVATVAYASSSALPRATTDRPDDVTGPQIHVVYAVPAGGEDRHLDDNGTIEGSVSSFQLWLEKETGGKALRMDTYQGSLDVSFARLTKTEAELAGRDPFIREGIEEELEAIGFTARDKMYAVYYDGTTSYACASGFWPPGLQGNVVALYLRGLPTYQYPCASNRFAGATEAPWYWEFVMVHEVLHGLGFVPECAPHHHRAGHVTSPNEDLMWAGDVGSWALPAKLDVGRDDYYGHGRADCPDLANSPYLTANAFPSDPEPEPEPPPPIEPSPPKIVSFSLTQARSGRMFRATLRLDSRVRRATCTASAGRQRLRATRVVRDTRAECSWLLPRSARGKRLTGSVAATAAGGSATRKFSRRVS